LNKSIWIKVYKSDVFTVWHKKVVHICSCIYRILHGLLVNI